MNDLKIYQPGEKISLEILNDFIKTVKGGQIVISELDIKTIIRLDSPYRCDSGQREMKISYQIVKKEVKPMIEMYDEVKDTISGFKGIVVAKIIYATGCIRYEVKPRGIKDGKSIEAEWIDESILVITKKAKSETIEKDPGGPGDIPSKLSHP